jgi:hypothetical protein
LWILCNIIPLGVCGTFSSKARVQYGEGVRALSVYLTELAYYPTTQGLPSMTFGNRMKAMTRVKTKKRYWVSYTIKKYLSIIISPELLDSKPV